MLADFGLYGFGVRRETGSGNDTRMEIAVSAFGLTEGDLDVDAEAHSANKNCNTRERACNRAKMDGTRAVDPIGRSQSGAEPV